MCVGRSDLNFLRRGHRPGRLPVHGDVVRLGGDAVEPVAHRRKAREIVVALVRQVGVGVERDVGDGIAVGGEEAPASPDASPSRRARDSPPASSLPARAAAVRVRP